MDPLYQTTHEMTLAQLETMVNVVDKASTASDRWLFLGCLAIIIVGGSLCIRWLVNSIQKKDETHKAESTSMREAHATERAEWRVVMHEAKAEFLAALDKQQASFRAELAEERHQCAQERILDRETRHSTANALNTIGLALANLKEIDAEKLKPNQKL